MVTKKVRAENYRRYLKHYYLQLQENLAQGIEPPACNYKELFGFANLEISIPVEQQLRKMVNRISLAIHN